MLLNLVTFMLTRILVYWMCHFSVDKNFGLLNVSLFCWQELNFFTTLKKVPKLNLNLANHDFQWSLFVFLFSSKNYCTTTYGHAEPSRGYTLKHVSVIFKHGMRAPIGVSMTRYSELYYTFSIQDDLFLFTLPTQTDTLIPGSCSKNSTRHLSGWYN